MSSRQKVAIVFGASRGIGRQICLSLSAQGYIVVLCSKSAGGAPTNPSSYGSSFNASSNHSSPPPDPNTQESTLTSVLSEITTLGRRGNVVLCDVRLDDHVHAVFEVTLRLYGRLDAVIYNPGAIWWSGVGTTPTRRYDLMHNINCRGLYVAIQAALPIFRRQCRRKGDGIRQGDEAVGGRVVTVCPPIYSRFVRGKTAYAMTKFGASVLTMGLGMDLEREAAAAAIAPGGGDVEEARRIAITGLWPATAIESAATRSTPPENLRSARIFGDAVVEILKADVSRVNGKLLVDEDFLREQCGYRDEEIARYSLVPGSAPRRIMPVEFPDLTVDEQDDEGDRIDSAKKRQLQNKL